MKNCPEKIDLYRFIDKDLSSEKAEEMNQHIRQCQSCRLEVEEIINTEKSLRRNFDTLFSGNGLKEKVLADISDLKIESDRNQTPNPSARKIWFWIFAPGLAIIFIAALLNTIQLMKPNNDVVHLVTCQAVGENAFYNNKPVGLGKEINLLNLAQPVCVKGNFIFKVTAKTTSTFSHIGESVLKPLKNFQLEFINSDAVFKLLEGKPLEIKVNNKKHLLNHKKLKTSFSQADKKIAEEKHISAEKNQQNASQSMSLATCSRAITINDKNNAKHKKEPKDKVSKASESILPSAEIATESAQQEEKIETITSDSLLLKPEEQQPANPFEDQPLKIERK